MDEYRIVYTAHASFWMLERGISREDVEHTLFLGEVIKHDPSTNKSTVLCWRGSRPIHVVVGINDTRKIKRIVTAYEPDDRWEDNFRRRKQL